MIYKTGDTGFAIGKTGLSKTITAVAGKYSHTFQFIYLNGILCVFDAQIEGCYPMEFENWKAKFNYDFIVLRDENLIVGSYSNNCINYFGIKYDVKGLAVGLWKSLFRRKNMNDKFRDNGKFWCFELTARLLHFPNPEDWTGEKIYDELIKRNWYQI